MRLHHPTVVLGLTVLAGRYGANANAIPADLARSPIHDPPDVTNEPSTGSLALSALKRSPAGPATAPKPPHRTAMRLRPNTGYGPGGKFNPLTSQEIAAILEEMGHGPEGPAPVEGNPNFGPGEVVKKPPPLKPGEGAPARPQPRPRPKTFGDAIDRLALADTSDLVKPTWKICGKGKAKREESQFAVALSRRMSGPENAKDWATWQNLYAEINNLLVEDPRVQGPIRIVIFGGISAIALNGRNGRGKTGDTDFMFHPNMDDNHKTAFWEAVDQVLNTNQADIGLDDNYINDDVSSRMSDDDVRLIASKSLETAYESPRLVINHAWFGLQLTNKMDRIVTRLDKFGEYQDKDEQDAILFLKQARRVHGKITMNMLRIFAKFDQLDEDRLERMLGVYGGRLQGLFDGFDNDVLAAIKEAEKWC